MNRIPSLFDGGALPLPQPVTGGLGVFFAFLACPVGATIALWSLPVPAAGTGAGGEPARLRERDEWCAPAVVRAAGDFWAASGSVGGQTGMPTPSALGSSPRRSSNVVVLVHAPAVARKSMPALCSGVEQLAACRSHKPEVVGSSPTPATNTPVSASELAVCAYAASSATTAPGRRVGGSPCSAVVTAGETAPCIGSSAEERRPVKPQVEGSTPSRCSRSDIRNTAVNGISNSKMGIGEGEIQAGSCGRKRTCFGKRPVSGLGRGYGSVTAGETAPSFCAMGGHGDPSTTPGLDTGTAYPSVQHHVGIPLDGVAGSTPASRTTLTRQSGSSTPSSPFPSPVALPGQRLAAATFTTSEAA